MKLKHIACMAAWALPALLAAQTNVIDFESATGYKSLGVYDSWENSPFRADASGQQRLQGNVAVTANPFKEVDELAGETNVSDNVLGFQRSRFASNVFGVRVDLSEPFELTTTMKYVHVMMHRPNTGRVMLVGLGKRQEWDNQSPEVEQFNELCSTPLMQDKWFDAVFAVKGAGGIDIHSLVIVPDCEPTHALAEDFLVYVDNIEVNNDPTPRVQYGSYPINFDKNATLSRTDRFTNSIRFNNQVLGINQQSNKRGYQDQLAYAFSAKAGETVTMSSSYHPGTWMHSYVYLDRLSDGKFNTSLNDNGTPAEGSDVMAYSYYQNKNSKGESISNQGGSVQPPSFTVPADLQPGYYRLRYKVDWDCIDAGGNSDPGNLLVNNGGVIVDTRLNVHADEVTVSRGQNAEGTNGEILNADGSQFETRRIPYGEPFTFKVQPANGFKFSHVVIRMGYNLDGDSLVHDTPQYEDIVVPAYAFKDNTCTIPIVQGDVRITPYFPQDNGTTEVGGEDYHISMPEGAVAQQRQLKSITFTSSSDGTQTLALPEEAQDYAVRNLIPQMVHFIPGEEVTTTVDYNNGNAGMHHYLYIDLNQDGQFNVEMNADGTPTMNGELIAYTYLLDSGSGANAVGHNSLGEIINGRPAAVPANALPTFRVPGGLPVGVYRARWVTDWTRTRPDTTANETGGYIVDFYINVHGQACFLDVQTENGSVHGAGTTGLDRLYTFRQGGLTLRPVPAADGYVCREMVIRHGQNIDGEQYIRGNRQWNEYTVPGNATYEMPADSLNGNVRVTAIFEPDGTNAYKLVFSDEFNQPNGSMPDPPKWERSVRENPTWKRFIAMTEKGQQETGYIEDGELVLRCIPNTHDDEVFKGQKVAMISGAVQSSNKFSFLYGKVEGRLRTIPYSGNFPAFWMMPQDNSKGWPYAGEIDIWEQVNTLNRADQTIHTGWANSTADGDKCLGQSNNPPKSHMQDGVTNGTYHTFGLEWTEDLLTWYIDGTQVFSYARLKDNDYAMKNGQWPYDKPFYIILNQSVGNGGYAALPDVNRTYQTVFDWVRVYQTDEQIATGVNTAEAAQRLDWYVAPGQLTLVAPQATEALLVDAQGRVLLSGQLQGNKRLSLSKGVYVLNGQRILVP